MLTVAEVIAVAPTGSTAITSPEAEAAVAGAGAGAAGAAAALFERLAGFKGIDAIAAVASNDDAAGSKVDFALAVRAFDDVFFSCSLWFFLFCCFGKVSFDTDSAPNPNTDAGSKDCMRDVNC